MLNFLQFNGKNLPCLCQKCCTFLLKPCKSIKKALPWSPPVLSHVPLPVCALQPCRLTILPSPLPRSTNWPERPLRPASTFLTCWLVAGTYGRHTCQYIFRVKEAPYQKLPHTDWNTYLAANNIDSNCDLFLDKLYLYYSSFPKNNWNIDLQKTAETIQSIINYQIQVLPI